MATGWKHQREIDRRAVEEIQTPERRDEAKGALASLLAAHRLRVIGVRVVALGHHDGFDSWATK